MVWAPVDSVTAPRPFISVNGRPLITDSLASRAYNGRIVLGSGYRPLSTLRSRFFIGSISLDQISWFECAWR